MAKPKFPDRRPHGLHRRDADCGSEPAEKRVVSGVLDQTRPKAVAEKVKRDVRILASALSVPAVDDLGLYRMEFEATLCQPRLKSGLEDLGFLLGPTVYQPVVSIPTPGKVGVGPCHPQVERVVQETGTSMRIGLITPPCGVPRVRAVRVPSSCSIGAVSHRLM